MRDDLKFFIDGKWVAPSELHILDVINPADESVAGRIALGTAEDVDRAVRAARRAFTRYSTSSRQERLALLDRIIAVYERRAPELAAAITLEMGAPAWLAEQIQVVLGLTHLKVARDVLRDYQFDEPLGTTHIVKEPIGVCGFITPWNWPLNQISCKVAPALAVGCTMVLKPSEIAPFSGTLYAEIFDEAGRFQLGTRRWANRGRRDQLTSWGRHGVLYRFDPCGRRGGEERREHGQARSPGTRWQVGEHCAGGC
jgi:aldehyde dehydrogenase (NAD+)